MKAWKGDYIRVAFNSISRKWEVRVNSSLRSEHTYYSTAEEKAHDLAYVAEAHGRDVEISFDMRGV